MSVFSFFFFFPPETLDFKPEVNSMLAVSWLLLSYLQEETQALGVLLSFL